MALVHQSAGTANAASGSSPTTIATTVALAVGDVLVVAMAYDNSGTNGADPLTAFAAAPAAGAMTSVSVQTGLNDPGAASAGVAARVNAYVVTSAIASGTNISVSWTGTLVVRAIVLTRVNSNSGAKVAFRVNSGATGTNAVASGGPSLTTPSVTSGELVLCWAAHENGANITGDADTSNGSWGSIINSFNGSGATGIACATQSKTVTATGTQTFNPTGTSSDWIVGALIFNEVTAVTPATRATTWGTLTAVTAATRQTSWNVAGPAGINLDTSTAPFGAFGGAVSPSITFPSGQLVLLNITCDGDGGNPQTMTVTTSGAALTWTKAVERNGSTPGSSYSAYAGQYWTIGDGTAHVITVTPAFAKQTKGHVVFASGVNTTTPIGATGNSETSSQNAQVAGYTSTIANSRGVATAMDWNNGSAATSTDSFLAYSTNGPADGITIWKPSTSTPGTSVDFNIQQTTTPNWMAVSSELLPASGGGGTTPVSASRSTTWTTAATVSATRATTWTTATAVTAATRATTWAVSALVTSSRATTWNVASSGGPTVPWLNRAVYAAPQIAGSTAHTIDPSSSSNLISGAAFTPTAGRFLLVVVEGAVTSSTPAGWSLPLNGSAINNTGLYVWTKTAAGGDTFTTTHNAVNYPVAFVVYEFAAGTTFLTAASAINLGSAAANPTISGLTGTPVVMAAAANVASTGYTTSTTAWSAPNVEDVETLVLRNGTIDGYYLTIAWQSSYASSTYTPTPTTTFGATSPNQERLTWALALGGGGGTTPVSASRGTTWAVSALVSSSRATSWAALAAVTAASRSTSWATSAQLTATRSTTWSALQAITAASRATTWGALARVTASTRATSWNAAQQITSSRATSWAALTTSSSSRSTSWAVSAAVQSTRSTTWNVAGSLIFVQATRSTTWTTRAVVQQTRQTSWAALAAVAAAATRSTSWTTSARITGTRATTWNVSTSISAARSTTWAATQRLTLTRATTWATTARTSASRATSWNVAGASTRLKIGTVDVSALRIGTTVVSKLAVGSIQIWP